MEVFFDIGNTRSKYVFDDNGEMSEIHYVATNQITSEWLEQHIRSITKCLVANVAQDNISHVIALWCQSHKLACQILHSEAHKFGVTCAYQTPSRFGVDRWLALLGAQRLFPQKNCLVVDAGTATTVDFLQSDGTHSGGWILPGIKLLFSSLLSNTEKVAAKTVDINAIGFADNTSDAVNQAAWAATLGLIDSAKHLIKLQYKVAVTDLEIVVTGGNGQQLVDLSADHLTLVENLLFIGMQRYSRSV